MRSWTNVATARTEAPVNCLVSTPSALLCGMYQHNGDDADRTGGVCHWNVSDAAPLTSETLTAAAPLPGVFHMEPTSAEHMLVCCTDGTVRYMSTSSSQSEELWSADVDEEMVTHVAALSYTDGASPSSMLCSAHLGTLTHVVHREGSGWETQAKWRGHEFDAWCVAASAVHRGTCAWTGGDDGVLAMWDMRDVKDCTKTTPQAMRRFDAGVVTVVPFEDVDSGKDHLLLVGSYDESLYLMDTRRMKQPVSSARLGGGVWRCRRIPGGCNEVKHFGVAAMQAGAAVVSLNTSDELQIVAQIHTSDDDGSEVLVYDCVPVVSRGPLTLATCSFYNRVVRVWHATDEAT